MRPIAHDVDDSRPPRVMAVTHGIRFASKPARASATTKVEFPIDDNEIEGCRRCDGGNHSSEEIRSGVFSAISGFRRSLDYPKGSVP